MKIREQRWYGDQQPDATLTPRQANVMLHLAAGKPLKAIAKSIGVSIRTVKNILYEPGGAYERLGAEDKTQAVTAFCERRES